VLATKDDRANVVQERCAALRQQGNPIRGTIANPDYAVTASCPYNAYESPSQDQVQRTDFSC